MIGEEMYKKEINELMKRNEQSKTLPYVTTVEAEIKSDRAFVKTEIKKLLNNEIIQPSKSPYNSPIWTVSKKGNDEQGNPKRRMVIDFQKLNAQTIADRYPIPDITMMLQNLGEAQYFTTLDLESGFHQIKIKQVRKG